jgi:hypothetical protein
MGVDIEGWVEIKPKNREGKWVAHTWIDHTLVPGDSFAFGCLFGVRDWIFRPIAAGRGIPEDASEEVKECALISDDGYSHSYTWITWAEIQNIDLDEEAEDLSRGFVHCYKKNLRGELVLTARVSNSPHHFPSDVWGALQGGRTIEEDDKIYRLERVKRRNALPGNFEALFGLMASLAEEHGAENIRLVCWFDC